MKTLTDDLRQVLTDNIKYRAQLLERAESDPTLQSDLLELCSRDIVFFVNNFLWTKDPRLVEADHRITPFVCYPFQEHLLRSLERSINLQSDLLVEKSRDMGVTWLIMYVMLHQWLFVPGADFRAGSRKEEFVDKLGDIDTLFEKLRFSLQRLPKWMLPRGFQLSNKEHSTYMKLINPETGSAIIGESANEDFGSGGRRRMVFLDEFSKWEDRIAEAAWTSTADISNCRIVCSTPKGSANKFAQLAAGTREKINKITVHWTLHPKKVAGAYYLDGTQKIPVDPDKAFDLWKRGKKICSPWYDSESERRNESDIAQELDINYLKSGSPFFSTEKVRAMKVWQKFQRPSPDSGIPYGKYITGVLRERLGNVEFVESESGWLRLYEIPERGIEYVVAADIAEGLEKRDETSGGARSKYTGNLVADFNGDYDPGETPYMLRLLSKYFFDAMIIPENNNHGYSVCKDLDDMGARLYYMTRAGKPGEPNQQTRKRGFTTNSQTRPMILDHMKNEVERVGIEVRSPVVLAQMETFVRSRTGKPQAEGRFLDDAVMWFAIAGWVIRENPQATAREQSDVERDSRISQRIARKRNGGFSYRRRHA